MSYRVLLCDDAMFTRVILRGILEAAGHEVTGEAADGQAAIEQYAALQPDVVLMDMVMPIMGGIDAVKAIVRSNPEARIVMCSSMGQQALIEEALGAGARGFIVKPINAASVLGALHDVMQTALHDAALDAVN